ncbi:HIT domain-containing protein [Gallibacter sp. Marseille-QA0791]|uniref:HIT domain-containing protein n=1 Tax=Gallibacter sp. Marseille-QA0791 TaxID=3378781 RepID=UPI003D10BDDF
MGIIDTPILENDKYMAVLSLGGFIEGWTLIIPKEHMVSMKNFYKDIEFKLFVNKTMNLLRKVYDTGFIIFEHGANHEGSLIACSTNHAHLHVVPYNRSLIEEMKSKDKKWIECTIDTIEEVVQENEYWFYAENVTNIETVTGMVHLIKKVESQYFRKILAKQENCLEKFNYKEYGHTSIVQRTYEKIKR